MWWAEDWMACSQSLLVLSCVSGGRRLNNAEYTFGNKIIVTRLTDNNRWEITTRLLSSLTPRIMKAAHCGDRGVSGFIWNGIWNLHCQVLLASLHDKLEFLENVAVSANLGVWNILSSYSHILSISRPNSTQQCFCYPKFLSKPGSCVSNPGTYSSTLFILKLSLKRKYLHEPWFTFCFDCWNDSDERTWHWNHLSWSKLFSVCLSGLQMMSLLLLATRD